MPYLSAVLPQPPADQAQPLPPPEQVGSLEQAQQKLKRRAEEAGLTEGAGSTDEPEAQVPRLLDGEPDAQQGGGADHGTVELEYPAVSPQQNIGSQ